MSPRTVRPLRESDFDAAMAIRSFAFGHPLDGEHRSFLAAPLAGHPPFKPHNDHF